MIRKQLPQTFKNYMQEKLSHDQYSTFEAALADVVPISIRINPHKYKTIPSLERVPWCNKGFYLLERPIFTLDPAFHAGTYYVQEASSMFIQHILENIVGENKDIKILDLSAAPGGKSTLIANFLDHQGLLVANEIIKNRAYTLKYNLSKEGFSNVIVTNNDPNDFTPLVDFFDIILIDAPCSGEGMFRKDVNAITEWSPENIQACSRRQQNILSDVLPSLKPGGHLIYSTCTYNDHENIDNVTFAIEKFGMESVDIPVSEEWQITEITKGNAKGYQFYPHKTKGEGFFASIMRKDDAKTHSAKWKSSDKILQKTDRKLGHLLAPWVSIERKELLIDIVGKIHLFPVEYYEEAKVLSHYLRMIYCGCTVVTLNKTVVIPDHSLALSLDRSPDIETIELNKNDALLFLKKELAQIECDKKSWLLATFEGHGIGWLKNLGSRINNYLPSEYRILMQVHSIQDHDSQS